MKVVTIRLLLVLLRFRREAIVWNASEQLELRKHFDCMVEEVRCNLKVVERSEATDYVVLDRSVQEVVRIINARHRPSLVGYPAPGTLIGGLASTIPPRRREPSGLLPTRQWSPRTTLTLRSGWSQRCDRVLGVILDSRVTSVPFTAILNGPEQTTTDNHEAASTCADPHPRRWQQRPDRLCKQGVGVGDYRPYVTGRRGVQSPYQARE
jgi:hypothetical protein